MGIETLSVGDKFTVSPSGELIEKAAALVMLTIAMSDYKSDDNKKYNKEDAISDLLELIQKRTSEGVTVGTI